MARSDDSGSNERANRRQLDAVLRLLDDGRSSFASIARCAARAVGMEWGRVVQLDPGGRLWSHSCSLSDAEVRSDRLDGPHALADQFEGVVIQRGRSLTISNAASHRQWRQHPAHVESGISSFVGVPVRTNDRPWGVLAVQAQRARAITSKAAHFLQRLAAHFGAQLEDAYGLTALEEAQKEAIVILDELGHLRGQLGVELPEAEGPWPLSSWISDYTGCHREWLESAWARVGEGPSARLESWSGAAGDNVTLYRRRLGTIGLTLRATRPGSTTSTRSSAREAATNGAPGRVWLIQHPSCGREATVEMLEHLGYEVLVREPTRVATIPPNATDLMMLDVSDWSEVLDRLAPKWSPARQQLLIACDLEWPAREAGLASLRKPFRLQDLSQGLAELKAGR